MKSITINLFAFLIIGLSIVGCDDKDKNQDLTLNISGLEDLGDDYKYEGWIIVDGNPVTTGLFTVDANGNLSDNSFAIDADDLDAASTFVLTIEPSPDSDPSPSSVHVLAGDFSGNSASLTIDHSAALGNDFTNAKGGYILATPTSAIDTDEDSGVWFLDPSGPTAALDLPDLPAGWAYEGWVVINGTPVTTGTFTSVSGADGSAAFSGPQSGPPFPGEDFLNNAPSGLSFPTSLNGGTIVISIEPVPDNSPNPFTLKPLVSQVPSELGVHTLNSMTNNIANTSITGSVSR
jgi:hypothetical protein